MDKRLPRARFVVAAIAEAGSVVPLPAEESSHLRSRRLAAGDAVVLIDGTGREADAEVAAISRGGVDVRVLAVRPAADPGPEIWLGVAGIRPERLSWIAEKAGELGVSRLALVRTARTQAFRAGGGALARLERLVREAAKQSGSARWPLCEGPLSLDEVLSSAPSASRWLLDPSGPPFPSRFDHPSAALLVGPEGGWTDPEREQAFRAGWRSASLPSATLRAETAAIAAVVLARNALLNPS